MSDPAVRRVAMAYELMERSATSAEELRAKGFTAPELDALELLTRGPSDSFELYALRIAHAPGEAGSLARAVTLADLDDRMHRPALPGDPPYAWARRHIAVCRQREDRAAPGHTELLAI